MTATLRSLWVFKHFPSVKNLVLHMPEQFALRMNPNLRGLMDQRRQMGEQIDEILANPSILENSEHDNIFHYLLNPEKSDVRIPSVTRAWLLAEVS